MAKAGAERERITSTLPHPALELALDLAAHVAIGDLAAAIAALLAAGQRQLDLGARALEVDPGGNQGQPFLRGFADQALDLGPVQEQLAGPLGLVVLDGWPARRGMWRLRSQTSPSSTTA